MPGTKILVSFLIATALIVFVTLTVPVQEGLLMVVALARDAGALGVAVFVTRYIAAATICALQRLSALVPFGMLNYAPSVSSIRLDHYVRASIVGMLPWTAVYVDVGSLATVAAGLVTGYRVPTTMERRC